MINIVLVETSGEENLGSVCRAMANMDFTNLILVNPLCNHLSANVLKFALDSKYILENAIIYKDFDSIKKNGDISIAFSRRIGQKRIRDFLLPELPEFINSYKNANINLVFGREANGLTNEEIEKCDLICSIPSSNNFPSLNLSHAVIVVLYEIFKSKSREGSGIEFNKEKFDSLYNSIINFLERIKFFKNQKPQIIKNFIKRILLRARLTDSEIAILSNVLFSINGILRDKEKI